MPARDVAVSARPRARLRYPVPRSNDRKQATTESRANVAYPHPSLCIARLSALACGAIGAGPALRPRAARSSTSRVRPTCWNRPPAPRRSRAADARREGPARGAQLVLGRARPHQCDQAELRSDQPRQLQLGPVRRPARRSQAAGLAGAPDRDRARAELGHGEPQSPLHLPARRPRLPGIHDRRGAALWLGGVDLLDLERAQRARLPDAAVELQRQARLGAHLPRPLPGRLRGAAGGRAGAPARAVRRDGAGRLRHRQRPQGKIESAAASGGAAGVHARSAVPEREVQEIGHLRRAADGRLRPPRLLPGGRSQICLAAEGQRHDRLALAPVERAQPGRAGARDPRRACRST